jgi:hypothetical protein
VGEHMRRSGDREDISPIGEIDFSNWEPLSIDANDHKHHDSRQRKRMRHRLQEDHQEDNHDESFHNTTVMGEPIALVEFPEGRRHKRHKEQRLDRHDSHRSRPSRSSLF